MTDSEIGSHSPIFRNPAQYIKAKLKILTDIRGFGIEPTKEEIAHLNTLTTQTSIDNCILSIIEHHWG